MKALLAPKHVLFRRGLAEMLAIADAEVVGEAENVASATFFLKEGVDRGSPAD